MQLGFSEHEGLTARLLGFWGSDLNPWDFLLGAAQSFRYTSRSIYVARRRAIACFGSNPTF